MYAVFEDGSRQYRVSEGDVVQLDYREAEIGTRLEFSRVLLYQGGEDTRIGQPTIEGARVLGEVVDHPSTKLYIQHFRRRKNYRRLRGHRQPYTAVQIRYILLPGMEPPPAPAPTETPSTPTPAGETPGTPPAPPASMGETAPGPSNPTSTPLPGNPGQG
ncbi:MAG: 50S ribosomal protein L21 [Planctomycetes bacterium]|nr:50S ribosomal protein L21 [Planctomycetota bacterium]